MGTNTGQLYFSSKYEKLHPHHTIVNMYPALLRLAVLPQQLARHDRAGRLPRPDLPHVSYAPRGRARVRRPGARQGDIYRRRRTAALIGAVVLLVVVALVVSGLGGASVPKPPPAGTASAAAAGDPFVYRAALQADYTSRAVAGNAQPLFTKSPGGVIATAARVAALRPLIDRVTAGTGIDPNRLEGLVFVESAGLPEVIAGNDPAERRRPDPDPRRRPASRCWACTSTWPAAGG